MTENNSSQARKWGMWAHLSSLVWIPVAFLGLAFPILNILGPLIVWATKKNDHPFIDEQGKESLNFQISITIYSCVIASLLVAFVFVLALVSLGTASTGDQSLFTVFLGLGVIGLFGFIGFVSLIAILELALVIFAAVKANNGESYRYPLTIRFLS